MKRQLLQKLKDWQCSPYRKPLLLMGARQVGKTTLLHQFGKESYQNIVSLNFEDQPKLKRLFDNDLEPTRILKDLALALKVNIEPEKTLLIFDEIQECPNALNSLKYFNEEANEYHICGAGSLLGVRMAHTKGFPVGKVNFETLHPMNFIEFLDALEHPQISEYLQTFKIDQSINNAIHEKILQHLKEYFLVGGMPEAVKKYGETSDFTLVRKTHKEILLAYELDFTKHAPPTLVPKIKACFNSLTNQLAKENKKFIYAMVREGARARGYEDAVQWLLEAGLIHKIYHNHTPKLPLSAYEEQHIFKVYTLDVGLLNTMAELPTAAILKGNALFQEFHGSLTENFVTQALASQYQRLHYWTSGGRAEVDFVLQWEGTIYPLEVKSGTSKRKKSLMIYREKYNPPIALRTSPQNLDQQDGFINVPLYLVGELNRLLEQ